MSKNTAQAPIVAKVAKELKASIAKKEEREAATIGIYVIKRRRHSYSVPFCGTDDKTVLNSLKEISKTAKEVQGSNLYRIGSYCFLDAKLQPCKNPVLVLDK